MEETYLLDHPGVKKKILHGGQGALPHFPPGTKLVFHFQTLKDDFERTVVDDSRRWKQPMEIFVGKMFKMEVWEVLLTSMRVGEVAEFWCDPIHTGLYPMVSKGMRLVAQGKDPLEGQRHMCGMGNMFNYSSMGCPVLDDLMREPQSLIFIMELISVGDPLSYNRESWMMDKDEKLQAVPSLHLQGNTLVKLGRYREAAAKYQEAVLLLRTVRSKEMPGDEYYIHLGRLIIPLVLNYCQCMLELEEYYEVLEHTTELLEKHKGNMRALYQRARAHSNLCHEEEAKKDLNKLQRLYPKFKPAIRREMRRLGENMRRKHVRENKNYWTTVKERYGSEGKGQAARRAGKKKGAGSVRVQKRKACKREIEQKVEEAQDDRDVAPNEEASGLDHRAGDRVKAPADADAGRDKAGNADKSGGDEIAEDAPLAGAAESSNNNTEGIKELSVMNVDCTINHESANKESKRTDTGSSNAGTKSSNKSPSGADGPHHCHVPVGEGTGRVGNTDEANAAKGAMPGSVGQRDAKVESPAGQSASGLEAVEPKTTPSAAQADKGSKTSKRRHKKKK
uniref:AIP/AIPL N-terminal FKBP-type PPIase domain-containing protein n=1 Tax=Denticeps clupeoides TaxID=299321 RepID=A0AAY4EFF3_9TELE